MPPPRLYLVSVHPLLAAALRADHPDAEIVALPALGPAAPAERPDLVVTGRGAPDRARAWATWGEVVVVVEVEPRSPVARAWRSPSLVQAVELGPGFLAPFLPRD